MKEGKQKFGKKWIIVLGVLVLIAIAVTLVIVLMPKNPKQMIDKVQEQSQTMFLKGEGQEKQFLTLQKKVKSALPEVYDQDTDNVYSLAQSLNKIVEYYSFPLSFVEDGKVLQNRYRDVMTGIEKAESAQKQMLSLTKVELGDRDSSFIDGVWKDFKQAFVDYFSAYAGAIEAISDVYQNCIPQGQTVNKFSILVANTTNVYLKSINEKLQADQKAQQNPNESNVFSKLAKELAPRVGNFAKFVKYFDPNTTVGKAVADYNFKAQLQQKVALVEKFETQCNMTIKEVVDAIDENGFADGSGEVYQTTISFLKGELA